MFTLQYLLLSSLLFAAGVVLGLFFSNSTRNKRKQNKELLEKLEQTEHQHQIYQQEVGQHFTRTAELVNAMTGSYQAVFEHLRQGASDLCQSDNPSGVSTWPLLQNIDGQPRMVSQTHTYINDDEDENEDEYKGPIFPKDYSHG